MKINLDALMAKHRKSPAQAAKKTPRQQVVIIEQLIAQQQGAGQQQAFDRKFSFLIGDSPLPELVNGTNLSEYFNAVAVVGPVKRQAGNFVIVGRRPDGSFDVANWDDEDVRLIPILVGIPQVRMAFQAGENIYKDQNEMARFFDASFDRKIMPYAAGKKRTSKRPKGQRIQLGFGF